MSKNLIYTDYVNKASQSMGGFPAHPIQRELFLRACVNRSAEHMTDNHAIAACLLKYESHEEFQLALKESGKSAHEVAEHMARVLCKFVYHGIEDVMLVKYQGIMQSMSNASDFWGVVRQAYSEKMTLDGNTNMEKSTQGLGHVSRQINDAFVNFITEQYAGDDLRARDAHRDLVRTLLEKKTVEPLSLMPYEGPHAVFDPRLYIFPLSDADIAVYNNNFRTSTFEIDSLNPVGFKWAQYLSFSASNDRTHAINTLIRVLRGEGSKQDYASFEGIADVSNPKTFYAYLVGESGTTMNGILDPIHNLRYTIKKGSIDADVDTPTRFHPIAPITNLRKNPFKHYDRSRPADKENVDIYNLATEHQEKYPTTSTIDPSAHLKDTESSFDEELKENAQFHGHIFQHLGNTNAHLWTDEDLACLHLAMNLLVAMTRDDRCRIFDCFIGAFALAKKQIIEGGMCGKEEKRNQIHQIGIFNVVDDRDDDRSYLTMVPHNIYDAENFMRYVIASSIVNRKTHEAILIKFMTALQELLAADTSLSPHKYVQYWKKIHKPSNSQPEMLIFNGIRPALVSIHEVPHTRAIEFLYKCIAILCNYSIYAYEYFISTLKKSVFVGLPLPSNS